MKSYDTQYTFDLRMNFLELKFTLLKKSIAKASPKNHIFASVYINDPIVICLPVALEARL